MTGMLAVIAGLAACDGGDPDVVIPPGTLADADVDADLDADTDADTDSRDTGPPGTGDTAVPPNIADAWFSSVSIVDETAGSLVGTESFVVVERAAAQLWCEFTWTALDWASDPLVGGPPPHDASLCTDADGNPCRFAFSVTVRSGSQVDGIGICSTLGYVGGEDAGVFGYGYVDDYMAAGVGYGAQLMYAYGAAQWRAAGMAPAIGGTVAFTPASGQFTWDMAFGYPLVLP